MEEYKFKVGDRVRMCDKKYSSVIRYGAVGTIVSLNCLTFIKHELYATIKFDKSNDILDGRLSRETGIFARRLKLIDDSELELL